MDQAIEHRVFGWHEGVALKGMKLGGRHDIGADYERTGVHHNPVSVLAFLGDVLDDLGAEVVFWDDRNQPPAVLKRPAFAGEGGDGEIANWLDFGVCERENVAPFVVIGPANQECLNFAVGFDKAVDDIIQCQGLKRPGLWGLRWGGRFLAKHGSLRLVESVNLEL